MNFKKHSFSTRRMLFCELKTDTGDILEEGGCGGVQRGCLRVDRCGLMIGIDRYVRGAWCGYGV
jgi:hypothetical protein